MLLKDLIPQYCSFNQWQDVDVPFLVSSHLPPGSISWPFENHGVSRVQSDCGMVLLLDS